MKKTFCLMLCLITVFSLCACKKEQAAVAEAAVSPVTEAVATASPETTAAKETETAAETQEAPSEEETSAPEETEAQKVPEETVPVPEKLSLLITNIAKTAQNPDNRIVYTTMIPDAHFTEQGAGEYEALAMTLSEDTAYLQNLVSEENLEFESYDDYLNDEYFEGFSHDIGGTVIRADSSVVSIKHEYSGYRGGAHGDYSILAYNYDAKTGNRLAVSDLVNDTEELRKILAAKLEEIPDVEYFEDSGTALMYYAYDADHSEHEKQLFSFAVGNEAVTFWFNPYELSAYAFGIQEIVLPYSDYPDLFNKKYTTSRENYAEPVDEYVKYPLFTLEPTYNEYGIISGLTVNGETFDTFTYSTDPYLVKKDGTYYLYIFCTEDDDGRFLEVIRLTGDKPSYVGRFEGTLYVEHDVTASPDSTEELHISEARLTTYPLTDPEDFPLSAANGVEEYRTGSDGLPVRK